MAISITIGGPHTVAFPTKIRSGNCGHVLNLTLQQDLDNGAVRGVGDWIELDNYKDAAPASGSGAAVFQGVIRGKSARGNWYVEVTADTTDVWVYQDVIIPEAGYGRKFAKEENFYNAKGDVVRAYTLCKYDIFEVSKEAFVGTPAANKAVTANAAGKLVVGA